VSDPDAPSPSRAVFPTTRWSQVLEAGDPAEPRAREALGELCRAYWYPLYAFVRRKGFPPDESADLVQGTFANLLARHGLEGLVPGRGRFRSFLMASCANHIADCRDRDRAARRGGGRVPFSIDRDAAESRYGLEPADSVSPERLFERRWALDLLESAASRLESEMIASGKAELFRRLLPTLTGRRGETPLADVADALGLSEGAVKMAASRLRRRYGQILRAEIARTVADPADIEAEIAALFGALGR
jgi:RNA polymerase sigma-70 factor (ECF subfamily)